MIKTIPSDVSKITGISQEEFEKSQEYEIDKLSFKMLKTGIEISEFVFAAIFLIEVYFWNLTGTFGWISSQNEFLRSLLFIAIIGLLDMLTDIPISLYKHFALEERHGFNKMTLE